MSGSMYDDMPFWGTEKIAQHLKVSPRTVKKYINQRGLPATLIGGTYFSTELLITRWVRDQATEETKKRMARRGSDGMKEAPKVSEEATTAVADGPKSQRDNLLDEAKESRG